MVGDTIKYMLTNTAPVATNGKYGDISGTELANGNGYTTGGEASTVTAANASGTETVTATAVTWTASGSMGPFRYVVCYDSTPTDKPLISWWDFGSSVTLASSQTFSVFPNSSATTGTLYTMV
jgi:hypothetical protein